MTLGEARHMRRSPMALARYTRAPDEEPLHMARARVRREIAAGTRCGCGLLLPHDPGSRLPSCTLPPAREKV